jgi:putative transposase
MSHPERKPNRHMEYNYSSPGYYFITICVDDRFINRNMFGEIRNKIMVLNDKGIIAKKCWFDIPNHFKNITIDEFIIMPDHVHGIIKINLMESNVGALHETPPLPNETPTWDETNISTESIIGALHVTPLLNETPTWDETSYFSNISPKPGSMPVVIRSYKSAVSKMIHESGFSLFGWQRSFHDRIIKNEQALYNIREYIKNNVTKWGI